MYANGEVAKGEKINVVVPTGNFGNILAAYYAKNMGVPIDKLICASNDNKVLYDFFRTGTYDRNREFILTTSPSMDILISSNLERLIYEISGRDDQKTRGKMEELKAADLPLLVPEREPYAEGAYIEGGMDTPSGKFELDSLVIQAHPEWGLDSLPTYRCSLNRADGTDYPFILCAGARIPHALHSRLHDVPWLRSLRPEPEADLALCDAERLGIKKGDKIQLFTAVGSIEVKANPTARVLPGMVHMYHGYREADVNSLMDRDNLDPYCGFPGFRSTRCGVRKGEN